MSQETHVTVVCYRITHEYLEKTMTKEEFEKFNETFQTEPDDYTWLGSDLIHDYKFEDWQFGNGVQDNDVDEYYFRAYPGDVTGGTDDLVSGDTDQSWQEPFLGKTLNPRKHSNYFKYILERSPK
jgi:hypothetical protein